MRKCLLGLAIVLILSLIACVRPSTTPNAVISPTPVDSAPSTQPQSVNQQSSSQPGNPVSEPNQTTAETPIQPEPPTLARIIIDPTKITLSPGESVQFEFAAFDQFDNPIEQANATWSTVPGATISSEGAFTASTQAGDYPDSVSVEVAYENITLRANASVVVVPGRLANAVVSPPGVEMDIGATQAFSVSGTDEYGNEISELAVEWRVSPDFGFIDNQGLVTSGTRAGTFPESVSAVVSDGTASKEAYATVTIRPDPLDRIEITPAMITTDVDATQPLSAKAFDQYQNQIPGISFAWVIAPEIGQIHPDNQFTAGTKAGTFTDEISAVGAFRGETKQGSATVTILPGPLATLRIEPGEIAVVPLEEIQLRPVGLDVYNNPLADLVISWSSDSVAGSVDTSGRLTSGTKANTYPEAIRLQGEYGGNTMTASSTVMILPGPLASLRIEPSVVEAKPLEKVQLQPVGLDAYNNPLTAMTVSWSSDSAVGNVDAAGKFTAGTQANTYPEAIWLQGEHGGNTITASANVKIRPGPISTTWVTPSATEVYTGDDVVLTMNAADQFGNVITPDSVKWSADAGTIESNGSHAVFRASRENGLAQVNGLASYDGGVSSSYSELNVREGFCNTRTMKPVWNTEWWAINDDGSRGEILSASELPGTFDRDWGYGEVVSGRRDRIRLRATTEIVVRREGPVLFNIGGDDGYRLWINGKEFLADWTSHSFRESVGFKHLEPGVHQLAIDYFENFGVARLKFAADADVLEWEEITECLGGYARLPDTRYVIHDSQDSLAAISERFGVPQASILQTGSSVVKGLLLPGKPKPQRKVIVLQGINSQSSCDEIASNDSTRLTSRSALIARAIQNGSWKDTGDVGFIDANDVIMFSYADKYMDCVSRETVPASELPSSAGFHAAYTPGDTCSGVVLAAQRLEQLINRMSQLEPDATFDLIGHSMGGMVAAYLIATKPELEQKLHSVITLDSPLDGEIRKPPIGSACDFTLQSWKDIDENDPHVVSTITTLGNSSVLSKFVAINSSPIGDVLPGTQVFKQVDCAGNKNLVGGGFWGYLLGALFNPTAALLGFLSGAAVGAEVDEWVEGHSCVWVDNTALTKVAGIVNGTSPSAIIESVNGIPTTVVERSRGPIYYAFTNTSDTLRTFTARLSTRRSNGDIVDFPLATVSVAAGQTAVARFDASWGEPGPRDIRATIWEESTHPLKTRIADSGWLDERVQVISSLSTLVTLAPIVGVVISDNGTQPLQYFAEVTSSLPTGCDRFDEFQITREGGITDILITNATIVGANLICTQVFRTVKHSIPLGNYFEDGQSYTVIVNDVITEFVADGTSAPSIR